LDCEVKFQAVISSEDGITKAYSGYQDGLEIGDHVESIFTVHEDKALFFGLVDTKSENVLLEYVALDGFGTYKAENSTLVHKYNPNFLISINNDQLTVKGTLGDFRLNRYYKSDFEGMFIKHMFGNDLNTHVVTFDCRTVQDQLDEILTLFK